VNFYIFTRKKLIAVNNDISLTNVHEIWHNDAECLSSAVAVAKFNLKIQDGGWSMRLRYRDFSTFYGW